MHHFNDVNFANLSESQVNQIKQFESNLNIQHNNRDEELIILAYSKPNIK